jgi:hypothetical protein
MNTTDAKLLAALGTAGVLIGVGKMLADDKPLKARQAIGRAILSGALGVAAGAIVIAIPGVGFVPQVALACILTSLGTSALEVLFSRLVHK